MFKLMVLSALCLVGSGCFSCAGCARQKAWGSNARVTCYSGGKVIYEGESRGQVDSESGSDGWNFMDAKTGGLVRISGDCVVTN